MAKLLASDGYIVISMDANAINTYDDAAGDEGATARAELIASGMGIEDIRANIGADSLGYISLDGMVAATNQPYDRLCTACFTGEYPIELENSVLLGKHALEQPELPGLDLTSDVGTIPSPR